MISRMLRRTLRQWMQCRYASTSAAASTPPMLAKIRKDMVTALKSKDANRLNVLRSLLADTTNAAKTSNPINTDIQLLALLRKRAATSKAAALEFETANRNDLKEKEESQLLVLEEYAAGIGTVDDEEVERIVRETIQQLRSQSEKIDLGSVMKKVVGEGGALEGKPVEKGVVAKAVKEALNAS